ncbi:Xylose isomerase domain-containing protein TIM barrel [Emticicia oligotrophica DSM 17448]|uniref:Xylose isomerase domain-containing protein TIM barrel n=1 Tax=Emticicia oligotrophica (strain DSM 17448 / CIP 109782 / MTCC 6937 / GPTSA100-15) TaxID=929562 RepID=A0ABM5N6U7_EMTOG|nr:sugar phosphate isomerase/epimerase [Emticicia oligotrophica]AFK05272.1 Xylose isomerase domain-containing protein TIM barrel [Emticicia oligotrophica DSM 17448]
MKKNSTLILFFMLICMQQLAFAQPNAKNLYTYPFGVQAYTFRNHFPKDVVGTLDKIQKMGITEIETSGAKGVTDEEYKKLCEARGITIPSIGAGYDQLENLSMDIITKAKTFGAKYVMCAWIPHKGDNFTIEDAKKAVDVFNKAGKFLKENGLTFCYHPHGYEFRPYENGTLLDYIFKNTNPEYVSFEMDVLWVLHGGGDPVGLLKKYGSRWKLMHVKDLKKGVKGDFSGHTPAENDVVLGTGQADWKNIFKQSKKIGIKHFFIEDESEHELETVPLSIEYLKNLK